MINFQLNTGYEFVFTGHSINNITYLIKLFAVYGVKTDWIITYNCPQDLPIAVISSKEIRYKTDLDMLTSFTLAEYGCTFIDEEGILINLLEDVNVNAENIIVEVNVEGVCLFKGSLDIVSLNYDKGENTLECDFKPKSYILNNTDTVINGNVNFEAININPSNIPIKITELIDKIYKTVNPNINVEIVTDFSFLSVNNNFSPAIVTTTGIDEIFVNELLFGTYSDSNFIANDVDNFGLAVKRLAFTLGCITGFVDEERAVFIPFLSPNKQVRLINENLLINFRIEGIRDKYDCIKISNTGKYFGKYTEIQNKYFEKDIYTTFYQNTENGLIEVSKFIIDGNIYDLDEGVLKYWSDYIMSKKYCFEYVFELIGLDYKPNVDLKISGKRYAPSEIILDLEKYTSIIRAVKV